MSQKVFQKLEQKSNLWATFLRNNVDITILSEESYVGIV